ncbi:MAG TPA: haloacid dehalogenase-like hydrolase [Desulfobacteraceae bacterium]|nr:haloacid dehalogenase-like hydrolase [Desulfobacteraceae bacterium]
MISLFARWPLTRLAIAALIAAFALSLFQASECRAVSRRDALPSWKGDVRELLVDFIFDVSTFGDKDFIPGRDRLAVFDMDGTLLSEKPLYFVLEATLHYLIEHASEVSAKGPEYKALCDAAMRRDLEYLRKDLDKTFSLSFEGRTFDFFRDYCLKVFETAVNPEKKRPLRELVYKPMIELIDLLHERGFSVYVVSGALQFAVMAISEEYLHVDQSRCIGSMVTARAEKVGDKTVFIRGKISPPVNLDSAKSIRIKMRTGRTPVLAFGNSYGDIWMLEFTASSPYRHLSCVIDHDDPAEFVYCKEGLLDEARKNGWPIISMKNHFKTIFREAEHDRDTSGPSNQGGLDGKKQIPED